MSNLDNAIEAAALAVLNTNNLDRAKSEMLQALLDHGFSVYPTRASPTRRAAVKATRMTPTLARRIRRYAAHHPDKSQREIGVVFNVDGGRVSEAVRGLR
jgi:hypothetical protein